MDVIKQLMAGSGNLLAKIFTGKDEQKEYVMVLEEVSPTDLHMLINALVSENKINEAENLLFEFMKKSPSAELYKTGLSFYERIGAFSDKKLKACDYSRAEISEGVCDLDALKTRTIIF